MGKIMTKLFLCAVLALLLAGCFEMKADEKSLEDKHPWSGEWDAMTSRGILVLARDTHVTWRLPPMPELLEIIDRQWTRAQMCSSIYIDPDRPLVVHYVSAAPSGLNGFIYWKSDYVYMQVHMRDVRHWRTTRHEMTHYLLKLAGGDGDPDHSSGIWDMCD